MPSKLEKSLMRQCLMALRSGIPGSATRHVQLAMMAEVANTLAAIHAEEDEPVHPIVIAMVEGR